MKLPPREVLARLGRGEPIARVCTDAGLSRPQFDAWWQDECRRRVPPVSGSRRHAGLKGGARIVRDRWGIPHVHADDADLFFAFGYATGQDRLFQLDYLRRKARGRLAEILGPGAVESDLLARTIGLAQIAEKELQTLPADVRELLSAYTAGVNARMEQCRGWLPIELDLLE